MTKNRSRLYLYFTLALGCELLLFTIDVVLYYAKSPYILSWLALFKDILAITVFAVIYSFSRDYFKSTSSIENNADGSGLWIEPVEILKKGTTYLLLMIVVLSLMSTVMSPATFSFEQAQETKVLVAGSLYAVIKSHIVSLSLATFLSFGLIALERLVLFRRLQNTKTNFLTTIGLLLLGALASLGTFPGEQPNIIAGILLGVGGAMMLTNIFRLSWIMPMSRRDKLRSIFLVISILVALGSLYGAFEAGIMLLAFSNSSAFFWFAISIFLGAYLSTAFLSLLFYLPTSEAIEKKAAEVRNLYAMSKFITDVFDEEKIYSSLVNYASESFGNGASVWFDIYQPYSLEAKLSPSKMNEERELASKLPTVQFQENQSGGGLFKTVSQQNIDLKTIHDFSKSSQFIWSGILAEKRPVRIDDVLLDKRLNPEASTKKSLALRLRSQLSQKSRGEIASMVSVPLIARSKIIGVLHVSKDVEYGFVKEDIELVTTFADQAAIAIDNSRLIRELIDKKRLEQELSVAQKIQLKLLPQSAILVPGFDIDGVSYPAYEVGGDYYDFAQLNEGTTVLDAGVVIADVSGKGTSAAFYMAEMKGIFQSLCRIYPDDPKSLLIRANEAITKGLDKGAFVSALYAVIRSSDNSVLVANAGHCPPAFVHSKGSGVLRMSGLALGLDKSNGCELFKRAVSEQRIFMKPGDVLVLYTDGVIEAVSRNGDQFGYENLLSTVEKSKEKSAFEIKGDIFHAVNAFTADGGSVNDDLTIVVIKLNA
ncbi:MAG: PP2C family protein-serine/threonine phosphatase [Chloroherpetonaceae bacterium]|nr:PP2C family protein-serine/threonine phosphatase [Chloroherpetonaceae bacterium]